MKILNFYFILMSLSIVGFPARAIKLEYYGEASIANNTKFKKTTIGGLSAIVYSEDKLWALSDDKGKFGDPRFYIFDLKIEKKHVSLKAKSVHAITDIPKSFPGEKIILDLEGLAILTNNRLMVSSENNNDKKPRIKPRLLMLTSAGKYIFDIAIPDKFVPESLGMQEKGLRNNAGFEGLASTSDAKWFFAAHEAALVTDELVKEDSKQGSRIRILKYNNKNELVKEFGYQLDALTLLDSGLEVFRGVSEILVINETKLIVLERGVRLSKMGWTQTVALYLADLSAAVDVSKVSNLSDTALKLITKTKILDFETDLKKERPMKALQNFEGLSWGPILPNKKRSLLVISDNNFSKKEITELLVFAVEGE